MHKLPIRSATLRQVAQVLRNPAAKTQPIAQFRTLNTKSTSRCVSLLNKQSLLNFSVIRPYSAKLPRHTKVKQPRLSPTMDNGNIVVWHKKEGDVVKEGDLLCDIETDKAVIGLEATEDAFLAKIIYPAGSKAVPNGNLLCILVENKADVAAFKDFKYDGAPVAPPSKDAPSQSATPPRPPARKPVMAQPPPRQAHAGLVGTVSKASPRAKKLARELGVDLRKVVGTGADHRVQSEDVLKAAGKA